MILWRVHWHTDNGNSAGYAWFSSWRDAKAEMDAVIKREELDESDLPELERIEVEVSRKGVLTALRIYASHADNG